MIKELSRDEVRKFIINNLNEDPAELILRHKEVEGVDIKLIVDQIKARKKAIRKFDTTFCHKHIIFPSPLSVEQASSEKAAFYKSQVAGKGKLAIDLTGGLGVDTVFLSYIFEEVTYVEKDPLKAQAAKHNFEVLGVHNVTIMNEDAEAFISSLHKTAELIFIDPDRRPGIKKVVSLSDSQPNVIRLKEKLLSLSNKILIKSSPMLDISATYQEIPEITEVHAAAVNNDCKELLFIIDKSSHIGDIKRVASNYIAGEWKTEASGSVHDISLSDPKSYIYEPNSAILKAEIQNDVAAKYGLLKLHPSTHLYTSEQFIAGYPGRSFKIEAVTNVSKKSLAPFIKGQKANLTIRNFPGNVDKLKKKLGIKDGGNQYLFACRLQDGAYKLLVTSKV